MRHLTFQPNVTSVEQKSIGSRELTMHESSEIPMSQSDAYIGYCRHCDSSDRLIFVLDYSDGKYEYCMICRKEWRKGEVDG